MDDTFKRRVESLFFTSMDLGCYQPSPEVSIYLEIIFTENHSKSPISRISNVNLPSPPIFFYQQSKHGDGIQPSYLLLPFPFFMRDCKVIGEIYQLEDFSFTQVYLFHLRLSQYQI